jgi:hypothetical protein
MPEWWTYSPTDFVMFSASVYYRMVARYHQAVWPLQLATVAAGVWMLLTLRRPAGWAWRAALAVLAIVWVWVAWAFHLERYAEFNWPARWFAGAFAIQGVLLTGFAVLGTRDVRAGWAPAAGSRGVVAVALFGFALFAEPLVGLLAGRGVLQLELFGVTADPTAVATTALLLSRVRVPRVLFVIPLAWCVVSALTLWVLGSPEAVVLAGAAMLGFGGLVWRGKGMLRPALPDRPTP